MSSWKSLFCLLSPHPTTCGSLLALWLLTLVVVTEANAHPTEGHTPGREERGVLLRWQAGRNGNGGTEEKSQGSGEARSS